MSQYLSDNGLWLDGQIVEDESGTEVFVPDDHGYWAIEITEDNEYKLVRSK